MEALESPNPVIVSAPKSHVRPKRNMTPVILISNLIIVFLFISSLGRPSVLRLCLMRTLITSAYITALKSRMAKMGPRKAPKNTAPSEMKQLERWYVEYDVCYGMKNLILCYAVRIKSDLQSSLGRCVPAYNKICADCI